MPRSYRVGRFPVSANSPAEALAAAGVRPSTGVEVRIYRETEHLNDAGERYLRTRQWLLRDGVLEGPPDDDLLPEAPPA